MYMAGFSFNRMSLMGMTLCVGILVDDSIVVLENIHRHLAKGEDAKEAAVTGRMEIGMAAIAITLCDVVVFLPIAFMSSMTGQFFKQFGLTIVFASLFSLFISFTLTPMLASKFFKNGVNVPDTKLWRTLEMIAQRMMADDHGGRRLYCKSLQMVYNMRPFHRMDACPRSSTATIVTSHHDSL